MAFSLFDYSKVRGGMTYQEPFDYVRKYQRYDYQCLLYNCFFSKRSASRLFNFSLIKSWNKAGSNVLPIEEIEWSQRTDIRQPGPVWSPVYIIIWKIINCIAFMNNKIKKILCTQPLDIWHAAYPYFLFKEASK